MRAVIRGILSTVALVALLAGCSAAAPTPQVIVGTASPAAAVGGWTVGNVTNDPITGKPNVTATVLSSAGKSSLGKTPALAIRCKDDESDLIIVWGAFLTTDNTISVTTRIDDAPAVDRLWSLATDDTGTFFQGEKVPFIKTLFGHTTFVARLTPYNDSPLTAVFDITGIQAATAKISQACNWS